MNLQDVPGLNALLNGTSAVLVIAGWWQIRAGNKLAHILTMAAALVVSAAFLVSYLVYHAQVGSVAFTGTGWIRSVYFAVLLTHTVLAAAILPLVLWTVHLAQRRRWEQHVAFSRWAVPLWLYVSVSGVAVYWMLYRSPWAS